MDFFQVFTHLFVAVEFFLNICLHWGCLVNIFQVGALLPYYLGGSK